MAFREVSRDGIPGGLAWLRCVRCCGAWLAAPGLRTIAERAGVDRKTARRYVEAAQAAGPDRDAGSGGIERRA